MTKRVSKYYWWCQLGGWSFWILLNVVLTVYYKRPLSGAFFINNFVVAASGIILTHLFRTLIVSMNWLQYPLTWLLPRLLIGVAVCASLNTLIKGYLAITFRLVEREQPKLFSFGMFISGCFLFTVWIMIYFLWHYFQKDQQYKLDRLRLEAVVKDLELRTIKAQLNPHFIFNALNSIRALVDENPRRARTAITELSNILRSSMQTEKLETVSLENELSIVRDYLALENIRFEERLKVRYEIQPETLELPVPPMMLQTLVENAIKHGISKSVQGGILEIESAIQGTSHQITIRNTGTLNGLSLIHI